jgi:hypothetical protein
MGVGGHNRWWERGEMGREAWLCVCTHGQSGMPWTFCFQWEPCDSVWCWIIPVTWANERSSNHGSSRYKPLLPPHVWSCSAHGNGCLEEALLSCPQLAAHKSSGNMVIWIHSCGVLISWYSYLHCLIQLLKTNLFPLEDICLQHVPRNLPNKNQSIADKHWSVAMERGDVGRDQTLEQLMRVLEESGQGGHSWIAERSLQPRGRWQIEGISPENGE